MRRLIVVITAFALLGLTPVVASATTVYNETGRARVMETSWFTETPDGWTGGFAAAAEVDGGITVSFDRFTETWVLCSGDATPTEPDDDVWGSISTYLSGFGPGTFQLNNRFTRGHATAVVDLYSVYVDNCTGEISEAIQAAVSITIDQASTSPVLKVRGSSVFHTPGLDNETIRSSSTYREGEGTVQAGEFSVAAVGVMGKTSWRIHYNG